MVVAKQEQASGRREALLAAAADVFFTEGYAAASIDSIIERAGGSKRNIYNEFGNKEGLFSALVSTFAEKILASLVIEEVEGRPLRQTLIEFGCQLMAIYMSPAWIGVYRSVLAEANRYPDLGRIVYECGPARATIGLAEVLEAAKRRGEIKVDDCFRVAGHFVGLIRDNLQLQVVLGLRPPLDETEIRQSVQLAVDLFLMGVKPR